MKKCTLILLVLFIFSPVWAGVTNQQEGPTFTDQDIDKYKTSSDKDLTPQNINQGQDEVMGNGSAENTRPQKKEDNGEISDSAKKEIERELNKIVESMISKLETGDIEEALFYFVDTRKDIYRRIFNEMKNRNVLKSAFTGYEGVEIESIYDHSAQCGFMRKENGELFSYPISFVEYEKGLWKIYSF